MCLVWLWSHSWGYQNTTQFYCDGERPTVRLLGMHLMLLLLFAIQIDKSRIIYIHNIALKFFIALSSTYFIIFALRAFLPAPNLYSFPVISSVYFHFAAYPLLWNISLISVYDCEFPFFIFYELIPVFWGEDAMLFQYLNSIFLELIYLNSKNAHIWKLLTWIYQTAVSSIFNEPPNLCHYRKHCPTE